MKHHTLIFRSIYFSDLPERFRAGPTRRIFASVSGREFEFVRLTETSEVEAYDYPKSWHGTPRFVGYLPSDHGKMLLAIALLKLHAEGHQIVGGGMYEYRTRGAP